MQSYLNSPMVEDTKVAEKKIPEERNHIFYYKRRSVIKKVLELAK
jgi:hypothetical protein